MTLNLIDKAYNENYRSIIKELKKTEQNILEQYEFDLESKEISIAIATRLKTYYETQNELKSFLNKRYIAPASDYFVESVLFFLRVFLEKNNSNFKAESERQIRKKRSSIRPDISIWNGEEVVAIIECKTQLGWNRGKWEEQYEERDKKLKNEFPNANSFLVVMTGENWGGFGDHKKLNEYFYCLLKDLWPTSFRSEDQIFTPIEKLFEIIINLENN